MQQRQPMVDLGFTTEQIPAGTHICYIFDNDAERARVITEFFQAGAASGDRLDYYSDRLSKDDLLASLERSGVDTAALLEADRLSIAPAETVYCPGHHFCGDRVLHRIDAHFADLLRQGHPGIRVSGEMQWALQGEGRLDGLLDYEARLSHRIAHLPVTGICQYDARRFNGRLLHSVLAIHPYMIVRGQLVGNPYYEDADTPRGEECV